MQVQQHLVLVGLRHPLRGHNAHGHSCDFVFDELIRAHLVPLGPGMGRVLVRPLAAQLQWFGRALIGDGVAQKIP